MSRPALLLAALFAVATGCDRKPDPSGPAKKVEPIDTRVPDSDDPGAKADFRRERSAEGARITTFMVVSAEAVTKTYQQGEQAGNAGMKDKRFRVYGEVERVGNLDTQTVLVLKGDGSGSVGFVFPKDSPKLAGVKAGESVVVDGSGAGLMSKVPTFRDCELRGSGYPTVEKAKEAAHSLPVD